MNDDVTPSVLTFLLAYGGFFVVSLLLLLALNRMRRNGRRYVNAQRHFWPGDVVEDDGSYDD